MPVGSEREPDDNGEISTGAEIHNGKCRPEIPYVDGVPMPPSVRPVIILQGSDYELGYQYYQQLVEIYGTWIPSHKWGYLYYCTPLHREDFSTEEKSALKEFQAYIDRYAPEWTAIFEGMAAGATDAGVPLTYEDLLAFFVLYEELYHWSPKSFIMPGSVGSLSGGEPARPACSGFAAWGSRTKDGKMLCVGNADDDSGFFASTVMVFPETGNNFITSPFDMPGFGGFPSHPGTNNKGLVYVHHGTGRFFFSDWGYTVPRGIADMHLLRFASNAEEAAEMHLAYPKAVNFKDGIFLADVGGDALVIESRDPVVVRRAGDLGESDFLYCTNNYQSPRMGDNATQEYIPHGGWLNKKLQGKEAMDTTASSVSRNLFLWNMLHNYPGQVDVEFAKMMYRFPSTITSPTLEEADAAYLEQRGQTYRTRVGHLHNTFIGIVRPDDGPNASYYVCSGPATRATGPSGPDSHNYAPGQTYAFYELKLAESPRAVAQAALSRARYDLYYANAVLGRLSYLEAAPLEPIFDKARTEHFKGHYYLNGVLAGRITGRREITAALAKATRCYTRCQVYAQTVCDAVAPPPSRPEHLGLVPWLDELGDWQVFFEDHEKSL